MAKEAVLDTLGKTISEKARTPKRSLDSLRERRQAEWFVKQEGRIEDVHTELSRLMGLSPGMR